MPRVRRENTPPALIEHLAQRVREREISREALVEVLEWLEMAPIVPIGAWFKRFNGVIVCGNGELIRTFLRSNQTPLGTEVI